MSAPPRPAWLGGAVVIGPTPEAFATRILDGLRRRLGHAPTGEEIRDAMGMLDATRSELARAANAVDRGASK